MNAAVLVAAALVAAAPGQAASGAPRATPAAPEGASAAIRGRAADLLSLFGEGDGYDTVLTAQAQAAMPRDRFDGVVRQVTEAIGKPRGVQAIAASGDHMAVVRLAFENGVMNADLAIEPAPPHRIAGLLLRGIEANERDVPAVARALASLPGSTGFRLARLTPAGPTPIAGTNADRSLAIGSAFKLVILAELVRSVNAGERDWTDDVVLDGRPLAAGAYTYRPKGVSVPIAELAGRMISASDNSATDVLLFHLGRERVEAMLPVVGMTDGGARNRPFLGALEMFKLKGVAGGALGTRYLSLDEGGRRALLANEVAAAPVSALPADLFQDRVPIRIDAIEWFASADDLVRTLDWLRRNTEGPAGAPARAILAKNPGVGPATAAKWAWVGYKGGSEPGVINQSFLLHGLDGHWYALAGSWNDPARAVNEMRFLALMARAVNSAGASAAGGEPAQASRSGSPVR